MDTITIIRIILFILLFIITVLVYFLINRGKDPKRKLIEFVATVTIEYLLVFALGTVFEYIPNLINDYIERDGGMETEVTEETTGTEPNTEYFVDEGESNETPESVYINEMNYEGKHGKLWTRSSMEKDYFTHAPEQYPDCLEDMSTDGHTAGLVTDNRGNVYTYGLHLDAAKSDVFYISYELDGSYTKFTGTCAFPGNLLSPVYSCMYEKNFVIYGDEKILYESPMMNENSDPDPIDVDVTGVNTLTIVYPNTHGPNEVATLFDGMLS